MTECVLNPGCQPLCQVLERLPVARGCAWPACPEGPCPPRAQPPSSAKGSGERIGEALGHPEGMSSAGPGDVVAWQGHVLELV